MIQDDKKTVQNMIWCVNSFLLTELSIYGTVCLMVLCMHNLLTYLKQDWICNQEIIYDYHAEIQRDFETALRPELFFSRPVVSVDGFLPLPDWRRWGVLCGGRGFAVRTDDDDDDITVSRDEKNDSGCSGSCAPLPLNAKLLNRSLACLRP